MKYIDADKLIVEIEKLNSLVPYESKDRHDEGLHDAYKAVKNVIDSLQQEQPEVEKEIDAVWNPRFNLGWDEKSLLSISRSAFETIARHFYELGKLNVRKEK